MFRIDNLFRGMVSLLEFRFKKALSTNLFYASLLLTKLLSGFLWNHCPDWNGITVRFPVESVSGLLWNMQSTALTGFPFT